MAITRQKKPVPYDLPPARLFLDDVEEVVAVFQDGTRYGLWPSEEALTLRFVVKDLECDSVEDLQELAGNTLQFSIEVTKGTGYVVELVAGSDTRSRVTFFGVTDDGKRLLYARILEIFDRRTVMWKYILHRIPWWVYVVGIYSLFLFLVQFIPALKEWSWIAPLASVALALLLLGYVWYSATVRYTVIELRYLRERSGALRTLKSWLPYLVAAILGSIVTVAADRIIRAIWP